MQTEQRYVCPDSAADSMVYFDLTGCTVQLTVWFKFDRNNGYWRAIDVNSEVKNSRPVATTEFIDCKCGHGLV